MLGSLVIFIQPEGEKDKKRDLHSKKTSPEPSVFVTSLYLSWFSHWFDKMISLVSGLIFFLDQI